MSRYSILAIILVTALFNLSGCASNLTGSSYSREEARTPQKVQIGIVEFVRPVVIEGTKTPIGAGAGAVVGGIAGSSVGDGKGAQIASVLGSVVGGVVGATAEEELTKSQGVEVTVRLENGEVIAVVQKAEKDVNFKVGDRVRVLKVQGNTRVSY